MIYEVVNSHMVNKWEEQYFKDGAEFFMNKKSLLDITKICMYYFVALIIISTLIGTINSFIGLKWSYITIFSICAVSIVSTYFLLKTNVFEIDSLKEWFLLFLLTAFAFFIYKNYAPSISIQQDQSIYITKALNLYNYGFLDRPIELYNKFNSEGLIDGSNILHGYGALFSGHQIKDGFLCTDFYSGGAYFYALFAPIKKSSIFWGQSIIAIINIWLLFFLIKKTINDTKGIESVIYTICFAIAPISVWFGRSSSTEPIALFAFLLMLLFLRENSKVNIIWMSVLSIFALTTRIDYFLFSAIIITIITLQEPLIGFCNTIALCIYAWICSKVFWIYYTRISLVDMKLVKYEIPIFILAFLFAFFVRKFNLITVIDKLYKSKFLKILICIWGIGIALFMFRDNVIPIDKWNTFTQFDVTVLSYEERIMDCLFLVFPNVIIIAGLLGATQLLLKEKNKWFGIFFFLMTGISSFFVYKSGNAPQNYFLMRRYYNVFIPAVLLLFVVAVNVNIEKNKTRIFIAFVSLLISINLFADSRQKLEYSGIVQSVTNFEQKYNEDKTVLVYLQEQNIDISPMISYCKYDIIPVQNFDELKSVSANVYNYTNKNVIFVTKEKLDYLNEKENIGFKYYRMGEVGNDLPRTYYEILYNFYIYDIEDIIKN